MKLYISEGAVWLLLILYMPLVLWLLWKLWRALTEKIVVRISAIAVALITAIAIPLWDVVITSLQMAKLCPLAGVVVKRSVHVDGYLTKFGSPDLIKRGFKFIETHGMGGKVIVYTKQGDIVEELEFNPKSYQLKSKYEFIENEIYGQVPQGLLNIDTDRSAVRDRVTGEELGYAVRYRAYPGWVDRLTIARIGQIQWRCPVGGDSQEGRLERQVLLPKE